MGAFLARWASSPLARHAAPGRTQTTDWVGNSLGRAPSIRDGGADSNRVCGMVLRPWERGRPDTAGELPPTPVFARLPELLMSLRDTTHE
jgi:hypothetical protein